jgi:hypothetical protein
MRDDMRLVTGVLLLAAGCTVAVVRFFELINQVSDLPWATASLSGLLLFMGMVLLGLEFKARSSSIERSHR